MFNMYILYVPNLWLGQIGDSQVEFENRGVGLYNGLDPEAKDLDLDCMYRSSLEDLFARA